MCDIAKGGQEVLTTRESSRLLKKSARGAVFDEFWEVCQKSHRKPPLKTSAFGIRCRGIRPLRTGQSYFNNLLGLDKIMGAPLRALPARTPRTAWSGPVVGEGDIFENTRFPRLADSGTSAGTVDA
jgi:hypothetical protein